jgi:tRNA-dihydrouridine synthase A
MTEYQPHRLSIAPMMDWTDRHCRHFHRLMTRRAMLYTEMVTAAAVIHGPRDRLLAFSPQEHPVALQLGGSDPAELAQAVRLASPYGYGEINLNVGCPSDRVQSGCFGAVLMERPALVAECVAAMLDVSPVPITVKCRIGVDDQDPEAILPDFLQTVSAAGVTHFIIHARKAWLQGLSPKENRDIPPLDYPLVVAMKQQFPHLTICINGGITSLDQVRGFLDQGIDGVMLGRAAYHDPASMHCGVPVPGGGQGATRSTLSATCAPTSPPIWPLVAACTRSPATCSACSTAAPAPAPGAASCPKVPTAPAPGWNCWTQPWPS